MFGSDLGETREKKRKNKLQITVNDCNFDDIRTYQELWCLMNPENKKNILKQHYFVTMRVQPCVGLW